MKRFFLFLMVGIFLTFAVSCGTSNTISDPNNTSDISSNEKVTKDLIKKRDEYVKNRDTEESKNEESSDSKSKSTSSDKKEEMAIKSKEDTDKDKESKDKSDSKSRVNQKNNENKDSAKSTNKKDSKNRTSTKTKESKQSKSSDTSKKQNSKQDKNKGKSANTKKKNPEKDKPDKTKEKSKNKPKDKPTKAEKTATISVTTGDVQGTILSETKVSIKDGDTLLDATQRILKEKGIQISVRGSGSSAYVEGIDNLYERDEGPLSGWHIRVNGKMIDRGAGALSIHENESINWNYTTDYTEDSEDW